MAAPVLECREVTAGYPCSSGPPRAVLRGVNLTLLEGQTMVVLGASGAGKSTLLRLLNRFDEPISGEVRFRGRPLVEQDVLELRRKVSLVAQTPRPFDGTVLDNLQARPHGMPAANDEVIRTALAQVHLSADLLHRRAQELSVGQMQRLAIARTLCTRPEVLLLDEPTSALDPTTSRAIAELIETLRAERQLSLVVVTHHAELAARLTASRALIAHGRFELDPGSAALEAFFGGQERP